MLLSTSLVPFFPLLFSAVQATDSCKCSPQDSCWPSLTQWAALNASIDGRLIQGEPPASVCYPNTTNYDPSACQVVIKQWTSSAWHADNPVSVDAPPVDNGCFPIYPNGTNTLGDPNAGERGCDFSAYPTYVVNATDVLHVQAGVKFAYQHNLRLNVKGTGHGKSLTPSSLSIWTHHMKQKQFLPKFTATNCTVNDNSTQLAMHFGAGTVDKEAFESAAEHNVAVVGGTDSTVGLVGWATGGGHGYMTGTFGQGADNILQATLVTPTGEILTANGCQHSDIFWAIRGGGGGTFGVLVDLTMKAYPMPSTVLVTVELAQKNGSNSSVFWESLGAYLAETPRLQAGGVQGYLPVSGGSQLTASGAHFVYNQPKETVDALFAPVYSRLAKFADGIEFSATAQDVGSFIDLYHMFNLTLGAGGGGSARTTRLIPAEALTGDMGLLVKTLEKIGPKTGAMNGSIPSPSLTLNMITSPVHVDNALNPAWRPAVIHLISERSWSGDTPQDDIDAATHSMTYEIGHALRQLAPDSGAYINESDENEPDWQWSLYGAHYPRLQAIKAKYDPTSSLWCEHCVGSEAWVEMDGGSLCKRSWT